MHSYHKYKFVAYIIVCYIIAGTQIIQIILNSERYQNEQKSMPLLDIQFLIESRFCGKIGLYFSISEFDAY